MEECKRIAGVCPEQSQRQVELEDSGSSAPIITSTSVAPAEQRPFERKGRTDDKDKRDGTMCSQYMSIYDERSVHELFHFNVLLSVPNSMPNSVPDNRVLCRD